MTDCQRGIVWLVGTGPGDPDLITLKALRCIAEADVIVHDRLIPRGLLSHATNDCLLIDAGKQPNHHTLQQEQINQVLADHASQGRKVCRLKGGDPFVFGRGGEEAIYLAQRGIRFEIVPGVTAGVGALAYAGIPLTHRNVASCAALITGHEEPTKPESAIPWDTLASFPGTLVFYMGVKHLRDLTANLIERGRSPKTPAALIENGTTPRQRTLVADLETLAQHAEQQQFKPPALIVIGDVVALRSEMQWFENRPLFGKTILVTRAREQASELAARLEMLGAEVLQSPAITIESLAHTQLMRDCVRSLGDFDWVIFTSPNAVNALFESLHLEGLDARAFATVRIAAIGPSTSDRLAQHGLKADLLPERFVAESLLDAFDSLGSIDGQKFLLPRSDLARSALPEGLSKRGAQVTETHAYRTLKGCALDGDIKKRLLEGCIDLVTFTSSSTVENFVEILPEAERQEILKRVQGASIGPITSETAARLGVSIAVQAETYTIEGLLQAIQAGMNKDGFS